MKDTLLLTFCFRIRVAAVVCCCFRRDLGPSLIASQSSVSFVPSFRALFRAQIGADFADGRGFMVSLGHINKPFHFSFFDPRNLEFFRIIEISPQERDFYFAGFASERKEEEEQGGLRLAHDVVAGFE